MSLKCWLRKIIFNVWLYGLLILFGVKMPTQMYAQKSPDFTITDTRGKTWNLYDELAKGKIVFLDFFFVSCLPCKKWSPEISEMHSDYKNDSNNILFLGISDRDGDSEIDTFKQAMNLHFPAAGWDGGGNMATNLYKSYFSFLGWPTYAVVCPDTSIYWDVRPWSKGMPELRSKINSCKSLTHIRELNLQQQKYVVHPNPSKNYFDVSATDSSSGFLKVYNQLGQQILINEFNGKNIRINWPESLASGVYTVMIFHQGKATYQKIIKK